MTPKPTISVVIPTYNSARFLKETIDSVLAQTYKDWEILLIDDASTDKTDELLKSYSAHHQILTHKNPVNQGVSFSRNHGLKLARGEWIAFLDSDDTWRPEKLEHQLSHAISKRSNFSCTDITWMDEDSSPIGAPENLPERITYQILLNQNIIPLSSVLLRKTLLEEDQFEPRGNEDFALWLRLLKRGEYCTVLNEPLTNYRFRKNSRSSHKLKSACNNWRIYRDVAELPPHRSIQCMIQFIMRSIAKYRRLEK